MLDACELGKVFSELLQRTILLACAEDGQSCRELFPDEKKKLELLQKEYSRVSWISARSALKSLLAKAGDCTDTSLIQFPNPRYSISHTRGLAVAAFCSDSCGIGIDLERHRATTPGLERFMLSKEERTMQTHLDQDDRVRIWTVKEAVFKSDLDNRGKRLGLYSLADPKCLSGRATSDGRHFEYASVKSGDLWITVSLFSA